MHFMQLPHGFVTSVLVTNAVNLLTGKRIFGRYYMLETIKTLNRVEGMNN